MIATTTINMTNDTVNAEAEVTTPDGYRKKRTINHKMKRHHSEKNLKDKHNGEASIILQGIHIGVLVSCQKETSFSVF